MIGVALAAHVHTVLAATPTPRPGFDQNTVTPGVAGFLITFGVAAVALLLILDMTRRIRRTRYREEIRAKLEAERDGRPIPGAEDGTPDPGAGEAPNAPRTP